MPAFLDSFCKFAFQVHPTGFRSCTPELGIQPSVCICFSLTVCVCVMESMCVNSCPCADPTELQPASLVPTDPSCCLIAQRKAITLKQHNTLAVSCRCLFSVPCSSLTIHGRRCHVYSGPGKSNCPTVTPRCISYLGHSSGFG